MRVLGILFLVLMGLALGLPPKAAQASPCPFHAQGNEQIEPARDSQGVLPGKIAATTVVYVASFDRPEPAPLDMGFGHEVPEGESCCHAAPTAATSHEPALGLRSSVSADARRSWLRRWAEPGIDIYRPPSLA